MVNLIKPTVRHAEYIAENMRDEDAAEVRAAGRDPLTAMMKGLQSEYALTVESPDGTPLTMLGVNPCSFLTGQGIPWLLSSHAALDYKREFLKQSPPVIAEMLTMYPRLVNYVHRGNKLSMRWLKWLGFTIHTDNPVIIPTTGEIFYKFTLERDHV